MALQSESVSAVLPEPTGPPMPIRSGPCELFIAQSPFSAAEKPRVLGFVPHRRNICAECRAARLVEGGGEGALGGGGDRRLERGDLALPVGLAERDEPHGSRYPVRG